MSDRSSPSHVVVDGSNIATEGRSLPSLRQLNEAVLAYMDEHPDALVTVVVDATFGHRIDPAESKEYEAGIANNELVAPPAGAVGRGDAFVLSIADKANATVLSNDSFQEFHGDYDWLFEGGRLVGGKPVPHVGWVFVERVPVRGPASRKATRGKSTGTTGRKTASGSSSRRGRRKKTVASIDASGPPPTPTTPPPGGSPAAKPSADVSDREAASSSPKRAPGRGEPVNDLVPFLEFVEHHPVGTSVTGTVESYSSHGAYVEVNGADVRAYVPLRLMADPPPRSARKLLALGDTITMVVTSFTADRRSIDCALPDMAPSGGGADSAKEPDALVDGPTSPPPDGDEAALTGADETSFAKEHTAQESAANKAAAKKTAARKRAAKKTAAKKTTAPTTAAKKSAAKKAAVKKTANRSVAKKTAAKKAAANKRAAKKTAAKKVSTKKTAAKKVSAKKTTAKTATPKKTAAKKTAAKKSAAKKSEAKKSSPTSPAPEADS